MGKNKGKRGAMSEFRKWEKIMTKLDNEVNKQTAEDKRRMARIEAEMKGMEDE